MSEHQEIVDRLREANKVEKNVSTYAGLCRQAADFIERQAKIIAEKDAEIGRLRLDREKDLLRIQHFVEAVEYSDSYGVPGSDFVACLCCRGGGAPSAPMIHEDHCPVKGSIDRYQDWIDEQREFERESAENRARALAAESERDAAVKALQPFATLCDLHVNAKMADSTGIIFPESKACVQVGHLRAAAAIRSRNGRDVG